ncbi:IclR family transcriptional regulator [Microbacterium sp. P01]|uniref:IclR family transcriptional regulator n=1 Tax=unclassified Microbacterium TaxID=2609290 RepID=UPI00366FC254
MDETRGAASPVGSVDKALTLIEVLADAGPDGAALRDLVAATGLNKASVHRLLQALMHRGFAEQDVAQRYRLGNRPALLVDRFLSEENLPALFRPILLSVSHRVQELVHLGTLETPNVLYLDKVEPDRTIRVWSRIGRQSPALTTALGRAMIAAEGTPDDSLNVYEAAADPAVGRRFRLAVEAARENGYAMEQEENEPGISCVAVALVRPAGRPVAVSITGPTSRMSPDRLAELGALLRDELTAGAPHGLTVARHRTALV